MPSKMVMIACDEQGNYAVGQEAPEPVEGEAPQEGGLQPVRSLDEALQAARAILMEGSQEDADQQAEAQMAQGFAGPSQQAPEAGY